MIEKLVYVIQWFFLFYFIILQSFYVVLNLIAMVNLHRYSQTHDKTVLHSLCKDAYLPISVIVPAYNEEQTMVECVESLLKLQYAEFEIIIVNDGSCDETLKKLVKAFQLVPFPEAYRKHLASMPIKQIFVSRTHAKIKVIDKENGGKADALNAGINMARYGLFCAVDADSILQRDCLVKVVQPFLEDTRTIAAGGSVRIANGCRFQNGYLHDAGLPKQILPLFQVAEYLRAFLFGRLGWSPLNALLIISGAFGVFRKEAVITAGGYRADCIGEDMELIVRMHKIFRQQKKTYRIKFVPDPICWTYAPSQFKRLISQRIRWHHGLAESLFKNKDLFLSRYGGVVGWVAYPFMLVFEWFSPVIEILGFTVVIVGLANGMILWDVFVLFFVIAVGFSVLLSLVAVMLEEMSFHLYPKPIYILKLFIVAIFENTGYRQFVNVWRLYAMIERALGVKPSWGK
ncbi:MAG: glycosyltransferase family 2 protein [Gammaproteobacteria bacterium]|nr:glycosyltransferase family 2 protein [Gammaproteobacteria bacterium]